MPDLKHANWRKSNRSGSGNCVEVADNLPDIVGVRDSKDLAGPVLTFTPGGWTTFIEGLKSRSIRS
ncbi:DUF397 domain-containing protein [Micromonospora inyonensis]|uniref:DUF397 domain-containing protein n=1 Tax=Micromonospora inyonensis TaxID=47866 RepID=A0A1C6RPK6_9ACTN|nr:DUF397 domain-containing protein [Micromonospora inyonensis]SCL19143.1 protein of unknown function [Micromonospora inyonensis]